MYLVNNPEGSAMYLGQRLMLPESGNGNSKGIPLSYVDNYGHDDEYFMYYTEITKLKVKEGGSVPS